MSSFARGQIGRFDMTGFTVLALGAPELSLEDAGRPLLLFDSTWRLLPQIEACLHGEGVRRTLPAVQTAYPRISKIATIRWVAWLRSRPCILRS